MTTVPAFLLHLDLDEQADERSIKRAYARELKLIDQAVNPQAFQMLREAYEVSLHWFKHRSSNVPAVADIPEFSEEAVTGIVPAAREAAPTENAESTINDANASSLSEIATLEDNTAVENYLAGFRSFCDDMVRRDETNDDIPWQIELRSVLSNPEFDSMYARGLFETHIVHQLASGWYPGHQTLFVAASSVFKWKDDPRRLSMFGQAGEIIDRANWEYSLFDELRGESYYKAAREMVQRLRENRSPTVREVLNNLPLLEMLVENYPTWLSVVSNIENVKTWREKDQSIPTWRRKTLKFFFPNGHKKSFWAVVRKNWMAILFLTLLMLSWWGAENPDAFEPKGKPSYSSQNGVPNSDTANNSGQVDSSAYWIRQIKSNVIYAPPMGIAGNPTVEYRLRLFTYGGVMKAELIQSSGWPVFDEAVLRGIQKTAPFSTEVPRDLIVSYKMFPNKPVDTLAKKIFPANAASVGYLLPPRPIYPKDAAKKGIEGTVTLRVLISIKGLPENIEIHTSSGEDSLDQAGIQAVKNAIFSPYTEDGKPTAAYALIPINFTLNGR